MSKFSPNQRDRIAAKSHYRCFYCGCDLLSVKFHIDHYHPFSKSKDGTVQNLVAACIRCNRAKSDLSINDFRQKVENAIGEKVYFFYEIHGIELIGNYSYNTKLLAEKLY